jgi:hypothetical protein
MFSCYLLEEQEFSLHKLQATMGQPFQLLCIAARSTDRSYPGSLLGNGQKVGGAGLPGMSYWWSMVGVHQYTFHALMYHIAQKPRIIKHVVRA